MEQTDQVPATPTVTRRAWRPVGMALAMLALAVAVVPTAVVGTATRADAAGWCGMRTYTWNHRDGVTRVSMTHERSCSLNNGTVTYIRATVYDTKCDGRSAVVEARRTNDDVVYRKTNSLGCGSVGLQFKHENPNLPIRFKLCTYAKNSFGKSSTHCKTYDGGWA